MKTLMILSCLAVLTSCGRPIRDPYSKPEPQPIPEPTPITSIRSLWINDNQASANKTLDLRQLSLTDAQLAEDIIECDGAMGNAGLVNGVGERMLQVAGDDEDGFIQVGNLAYVGATNSIQCRAMSREKYEYTIVGQSLVLKNVGYCSTHTCANDGVEVFQLGE